MTELSLAIIAKDEEQNLDVCLQSVKAHVDEIVVVDTGSTDDTPRVAEKHGARVYPFDPHTNPEAFFRDDEATCRAFGAPGAYSGEVMLGDFGAARRKSFSLVKGEYVLWLDADDVLENADGLRAVVAEMRARNLDMGFLAYDYARDHQGRTFYRQWRERIVKNGCATWVNPVHEVLMPTRPVQHQRFDGPQVAHRRKADRKTVPHRNYKILLRHHEQEKAVGSIDPRTLFYLGQEARWVEPQRSYAFYEAYLQRSGWPEERAAAHVALGSMYEFGNLGGTPEECYAKADREYAVAAAEMPTNPDGLFGLARIAYLRGRWQECVDYTARAAAIGNTESMLGANPLDRTYRPHAYLNHALYNLGRLEDAIASCRAGLEACPDDPGVPGGKEGMLKSNLRGYEEELAKRAGAPASRQIEHSFSKDEDPERPPVDVPNDVLVVWSQQLWKRVLHVEKSAGKAAALLGALPESVKLDPAAARMREVTVRHGGAAVPQARDMTSTTYPINPALGASAWLDINLVGSRATKPRARVVFWVGPSVEPWDPTTPNARGIGGSETACVEMARELAALGHEVTVYGELPPQADPRVLGAVFDGVKYVQWNRAQTPIECDVFVSSRAPAVLDDPAKVRAKVKFLWVHDVNVGPNDPRMERWLLSFDRVLVLSEWHRGYFLWSYPWLDPAKVLVTRNGIDPRRFFPDREWGGRGGMPEKRNHLVSASSPNRGLDMLVLNFPFIRARVPDAELHIYYGFDCWEAFARARGDQAELDQIAGFKKLIADRSHSGSGIYLHGRVGQRELAEAYLRAKVWPHFTTFTETSCISAMEAQAAGCVPVHSGVAALAETVKHGVVVHTDEPQKFVDECVRLLTDENYRRPIADAGRMWALTNLSWKLLALEWDLMFRAVEVELLRSPLPAYVEVGR